MAACPSPPSARRRAPSRRCGGTRLRHNWSRVDPPAAQVRQRPEAVLVAVSVLDALPGSVGHREPLHPALLLGSAAKHVANAFVALAERGADQHAAPELELLEVQGLGLIVFGVFAGAHGRPRNASARAGSRPMWRNPAAIRVCPA